jgi:hypothetical protein
MGAPAGANTSQAVTRAWTPTATPNATGRDALILLEECTRKYNAVCGTPDGTNERSLPSSCY